MRDCWFLLNTAHHRYFHVQGPTPPRADDIIRGVYLLPEYSWSRVMERFTVAGSHSWYYLHGWEGRCWCRGRELYAEILQGKNVRIMDIDHLMLSSFRCDFDDTAQYRVSAMNSKGELSAFASVVVKSRSHQVLKPSPFNALDTSKLTKKTFTIT